CLAPLIAYILTPEVPVLSPRHLELWGRVVRLLAWARDVSPSGTAREFCRTMSACPRPTGRRGIDPAFVSPHETGVLICHILFIMSLNIDSPLRCYALHTHVHQEVRAESNLIACNIETVVPRYKSR